MSEAIIHEDNLSRAWASAFQCAGAAPRREVQPLVVTIDTENGPSELATVRQLIDVALEARGLASVETVASTIFPRSLWNPSVERQELFNRYEALWPRIRRVPANKYGTYFRRFSAFGPTKKNQLEHILETRQRGNLRRSALQLAAFDPETDHTHQRQRGFPCLHQVAVVPHRDGTIGLTAFYATQTVLEKAYGNYLGLMRLGEFIAHEMGMRLSQVTCIASIGLLSRAAVPAAFRDKLAADLAAATGGSSP